MRPAALLPRLARCFLAEDRRAAQRLGAAVSRSLLPAARWRLLSRPRRQRRQEDRQRSAGSEARAARADRSLSAPSKANWYARRTCWKGWSATFRRLPESWSSSAPSSSSRRRRRSPSITRSASWPRRSRASNSAPLGRPAGAGAPRAREPRRSREAARASQAGAAEERDAARAAGRSRLRQGARRAR